MLLVISHRNHSINQEIHVTDDATSLSSKKPRSSPSPAHISFSFLLLLLLSGLAAVPITAAAGDALPLPRPKQRFWVSFSDFWVSSLLDSFRGTVTTPASSISALIGKWSPL
ncbi:hypothetical protein Droror1_Dr00028038 [Drosera rotundifolia]